MADKHPANIRHLPDQTFVIDLTLPASVINTEHQRQFSLIQTNFKTKGFRPGKVPLDIIKQQLDAQDLILKTAQALISQSYSDIIKTNQLRPVVPPKITIHPLPLKLGVDWRLEISSCQLPSLRLDRHYQDQIKKINQGQDKNKLGLIFDHLVKSSQVQFPPVLIESGLENKLSHLIDQTQQAGITVSDYLKSKNLSLDALKDHYRSQIKTEWTLNLAFNQIAADNHITVAKSDLAKSPHPSLGHLIALQQKVIKFLTQL